MPATTKTYLLGHRPKEPWSGFYCVPYLVLLLLCVGCNHILLVLHVDNDLLAFISLVADFLQDRLWGPIEPLLDAAAADALNNSNTSDKKWLMRKSDSLATTVKIFLKVESTFVIFVKVLIQTGFSPPLALVSALVLLSVQGLATSYLFSPIAKKVQELKKLRDECSYVLSCSKY